MLLTAATAILFPKEKQACTPLPRCAAEQERTIRAHYESSTLGMMALIILCQGILTHVPPPTEGQRNLRYREHKTALGFAHIC